MSFHLKILWISHRDIRNPLAGGAERVIHEVGKRLVANGHDFCLFTGGWQSCKPYDEIDGIVIHRFGDRVLPHLVLPVFLHERKDADVIVDDLAHAAPWFSPLFTSTPGTAFFRHLHARTLRGQTSIFLAYLLTKLEEKYALIYRNWPFVTESRSSETDLRKLGVKPSSITRIPSGVDADYFVIGKKSPEPQLIYFGGMRPYKRPEHALYSFYLLFRKGFRGRLVMVGDGPSLPTLKELTARLSLNGSVSFEGRLGRDALAQVVSRSWVNVHCSLSEGWCLSAMEAAAAGVPTAAYAVAGITESVQDGRTGILVKSGDVYALAKAVETLLRSQNDWPEKCRARAKEYSWEATVEKWETHLRNVALSRDRS